MTVQRDQGEWVPLFPMVEMKVLCSIGKGASFLLRLQPGARLPAHDHLEVEECLILEGELDLGGGVVLHTGDYHMAPRGLAHGMAISCLGALIFFQEATCPLTSCDESLRPGRRNHDVLIAKRRHVQIACVITLRTTCAAGSITIPQRGFDIESFELAVQRVATEL